MEFEQKKQDRETQQDNKGNGEDGVGSFGL